MGKEPKSRRHACPQCDFKTGDASHLRTHVRAVHEQRKDHACPQCDALFGQAGHLRRHVRTVHEQRKDHACLKCDAAFSQANNLRKHVRTVHTEPENIAEGRGTVCTFHGCWTVIGGGEMCREHAHHRDWRSAEFARRLDWQILHVQRREVPEGSDPLVFGTAAYDRKADLGALASLAGERGCTDQLQHVWNAQLGFEPEWVKCARTTPYPGFERHGIGDFS